MNEWKKKHVCNKRNNIPVQILIEWFLYSFYSGHLIQSKNDAHIEVNREKNEMFEEFHVKWI